MFVTQGLTALPSSEATFQFIIDSIRINKEMVRCKILLDLRNGFQAYACHAAVQQDGCEVLAVAKRRCHGA
jgi:hypothetical protein